MNKRMVILSSCHPVILSSRVEYSRGPVPSEKINLRSD